MVFSSIPFLFFFLPAVLITYWLAGKTFRNSVLLGASLFFYSWGEGIYLFLMLASIVINYCGGRLIGACSSPTSRRFYLSLTVFLNLFILCFFKYAGFVTENINLLFSAIGLPTINLIPLRLPIGISFFTFQALSYIIDVFRRTVVPQRNVINLALYISLFPQLIAGPIVRYNDIADQLEDRSSRIDDLAHGIQRFLMGLSKKVLLANPIAVVADSIFSLPASELTTPLAWLGAFCYTLQIYFDFSGYSDMAIGLGRMFGFRFLENFNYPYISTSIREFWRRWHISLSSWFRDYLYIPLGGSRGGNIRTYVNLFIVFILCGFWHGASWTFVVWGLYHGFFLVLERTGYGTVLKNLWYPARLLVTLLIIVIGWVIFRCETLTQAVSYLSVMFGVKQGSMDLTILSFYLDSKSQFEICVAALLSLPLYPVLLRFGQQVRQRSNNAAGRVAVISVHCVQLLFFMTISYFAIISLAAGVYNPFIYFRF